MGCNVSSHILWPLSFKAGLTTNDIMSKEPQENCNPIRNTSTVPHTLHLMRTDPGFISLLLIKTCFCVATITMRDEDWLDPMFFFWTLVRSNVPKLKMHIIFFFEGFLTIFFSWTHNKLCIRFIKTYYRLLVGEHSEHWWFFCALMLVSACFVKKVPNF